MSLNIGEKMKNDIYDFYLPTVSKVERNTKFLSILAYTSVIIALIIIDLTSPSIGYEISIYNSYPWYFWILIIFPFTVPFLTIAINRYKLPSQPILYRYSSLGASLISLITFLSLPFFRGYLSYLSGDGFLHIGFYRDVVTNGHFGIHNFYPIIHTWLYVFSNLLNLDIFTLSLVFPQIFVIIYILFIFLLSKSLKYDSIETLSITGLAIVPIFGIELTREFFMPSFDAFCMLPLVLFILIKSRTSEMGFGYSICLILILILFPFFHIETSLMLLIMLLSLFFIFLIPINNQRKKIIQLIELKRKMSEPILILSIGYFMWFSSTFLFNGIITKLYKAIFFDTGQSLAAITESSLDTTPLDTKDIVTLLINTYGVQIIFFSISLFLAISTFVKLIRSNKVNFQDYILSILFTVFIFITVLQFFKDPFLGQSTRMWKYPLFLATIFVGSYFTKKICNKSRTITLITLFVISLIIMMSILYSYPSPSINIANRQITESSFSGMDFFFNHGNKNITIKEIGINHFAYKAALYGTEEVVVEASYREGIKAPPIHFGYDKSQNIGNLYAKDQYLIFTKLAELYYPYIYPNYVSSWKYSPNDFEKLANDKTVNKIFNSNDLNIFVIKSSIIKGY